jgi:serine/threonine-protein kinase
MGRADAERNLFFGVLALQLDFISREALILAVSSWSLDKSRSLETILVEQGALTESRRCLLDPLVREHLSAHGDDPAASLAAFGVPGTVREDLEPLKDPDVGATLAASSVANPATPTPTLDFTPSDAIGSRYRVLRPLARGGIGLVSVALDTELNREVALKQIQPENADDVANRTRFTLEAEVTGRLEHPGVVPVYGLGCGPQGQPYYAMRLIKGESLKEAIRRLHAGVDVSRSSLALRGLLNRFVAVCYAVAYAHSRGVIHRDLKPSNIMLGPYGETLVVDWGLAKVVGREDAEKASAVEMTLRPGSGSSFHETVAGTALGTPAYMSPEQAEGRLNEIGPASDVYSLGATLYDLLTGGPPFDDTDVAVILRRVMQGDFPAPRTANAQAPRGLEAVCLKAMALRPAQRYPSARALAEEVEHWLADEPVAALREPMLTRLARWGRRHKTGVAAGVALLAAAVVGLAAGAIVLQRANARTQRERDLAQYHFRTARKAVDDYLTKVGKNPLLKESGLHDLRRELLEAALSYYQDFLKQEMSDARVRAEAALAYEHVGDIQKELGQFEASLAAYDKGLSLVDRPDQTAARLRMEGSRIAVLPPLGRSEEGFAAFERTIQPFRDGRPTSEELQPVLMKLYNAAVEAYSRAGKTKEALGVAQEVLRIGEAYTRDHPDERDAFLDLMLAKSHATRHLLLLGRETEGTRSGERGLQRGEAYLRRFPKDLDVRVIMNRLARNLANIEATGGRYDRAMIYLRRSVALLDDACRDNPLLFEPRLGLSSSLAFLSNIECNAGQYLDAQRSADRSIELGKEIQERSPGLPRARENLGVAYLAAGRAHMKLHQPAQAIASLKEAVNLLETSGEPVYLYNASCASSLLSSIEDAASAESHGDREARRARDAERAVSLLKSAIEHGFLHPDSLKTDPDFDPIRSRPDFQALDALIKSKLARPDDLSKK